MAKRLPALDTISFAYLFSYVMNETEDSEELFDEDELYEFGFAAFDSDELAEAFVARFRGLVNMSEILEERGFIRTIDDEMKFHPAVFEAAAIAKTRDTLI